MAKSPCPYCNQPVSDAIMSMHQANCAKRPMMGEAAPTVVLVPPVMPPASPIYLEPADIYLDPTEVLAETGVSPFQATTPDEVGTTVTLMERPEPEVDNGQHDEGLFRPDLNPYFVVPTDLQAKLRRVLKATEKHPKNLLLTGPQGAGKTSLAEQLAAIDNRFCYIVPCVTMQEPSQWWGYWTVVAGETNYVKSQFINACETPNCVVVLDDMNRVENPKVLNPLFPMLDDRRETYLDDLRRYIKVADGVIFIGTVNEGYAFQGTDPIDLALRDRFDQIAIEYPPGPQIEQILLHRAAISADTAERLGRFARSLADAPNIDERVFISMRQMIAIAEDVALGASIRDAVTFTIAAGLQDETLEKVNQILQSILMDNYTARVPDWRAWT